MMAVGSAATAETRSVARILRNWGSGRGAERCVSGACHQASARHRLKRSPRSNDVFSPPHLLAPLPPFQRLVALRRRRRSRRVRRRRLRLLPRPAQARAPSGEIRVVEGREAVQPEAAAGLAAAAGAVPVPGFLGVETRSGLVGEGCCVPGGPPKRQKEHRRGERRCGGRGARAVCTDMKSLGESASKTSIRPLTDSPTPVIACRGRRKERRQHRGEAAAAQAGRRLRRTPRAGRRRALMASRAWRHPMTPGTTPNTPASACAATAAEGRHCRWVSTTRNTLTRPPKHTREGKARGRGAADARSGRRPRRREPGGRGSGSRGPWPGRSRTEP